MRQITRKIERRWKVSHIQRTLGKTIVHMTLFCRRYACDLMYCIDGNGAAVSPDMWDMAAICGYDDQIMAAIECAKVHCKVLNKAAGI